jgi:BASS family bile acid:Na+ symporter
MLNRLLTGYTRSYAVWVVIFGIVAFFLPGPFLSIKPWMTWLFSVTMFGIGVALDPADFRRILQHPTIVAIGSVAQFTIMPLGAFVVARIFGLSDVVTAGLVLTGCAPGAMASNVMSYIAKADTAYSVSLTTVSTALCPLLTPGLTFLLVGEQLEVAFLDMVWLLMQMVAIPLALGFAVHWLFPKPVRKILPVFPALSVTFIVLICSVVIAANRDKLVDTTLLILVACVVLNLYGLITGYGVGKAARMSIKRRRTLSIEIGMQNAGLGATLAIEHLSAESALPAAIFVFVCIITASLLPAIWARMTPPETTTNE